MPVAPNIKLTLTRGARINRSRFCASSFDPTPPGRVLNNIKLKITIWSMTSDSTRPRSTIRLSRTISCYGSGPMKSRVVYDILPSCMTQSDSGSGLQGNQGSDFEHYHLISDIKQPLPLDQWHQTSITIWSVTSNNHCHLINDIKQPLPLDQWHQTTITIWSVTSNNQYHFISDIKEPLPLDKWH